MAITATDILFKLSVDSTAGNTTAQSDPDSSLGEYISTTQVGTAKNDLFDNVTGDQASAGVTEYRCIFVHNDHASLTWENVYMWISAEDTGDSNGANIAIAADSTGASAVGSSTAQALGPLADEEDSTSVLSGLTFSAPTTKGTGVSLGNIAAGNVKAIWIRRTIAASSTAYNDDDFTLSVEGDTAA